jgi:hypothetical protein
MLAADRDIVMKTLERLAAALAGYAKAVTETPGCAGIFWQRAARTPKR